MERAGARGVAEQLFGATPERRLLLLRAAWPRAVGPELARRTEVVALDRDSLRIRVPDAGWTKGLLRMKRDILLRLHRVAGRLAPSKLGFVEGETAAWRDSPGPISPLDVVSPAPVSAALLAEAERIADPELRARFLASACRYLDRFKPSA